jgi:soluble lytic murein transglycosylase-like protein
LAWQHVFRVAVVAGLGSVALSIGMEARAEGGEGPSVIIPQESQNAAEADHSDARDTTARPAEQVTAQEDRPSPKAMVKSSAGKPATAMTSPEKTKAKTSSAKIEPESEAVHGAVDGEATPSPKKTVSPVRAHPLQAVAPKVMPPDAPGTTEPAGTFTGKAPQAKAPQAKAAALKKGRVAEPAKPAADIQEKARMEEKAETSASINTVPVTAIEPAVALGAEDVETEKPLKKVTAVNDASRALALKPLIHRYASVNNLPFALADAVIRVESRYNAGARNGQNMGLTQINASTARSLGYMGEAAGLLDAETNLRYGLRYLAMAHKLAGGDMCGTLLRYQFGHRAETTSPASRKYCAQVKLITADAD